MFGHRNKKRAASNPPINGANANSSAATAAASAFLKSSPPSTSLSSAAAATALRSRPTTPVSVADVQTKRTLRRAGSTSSAGSVGSGSGQLQRRGSSGSMSERTFREPSPARSPSRSSSQQGPLPDDDAPPVPAIPKNIPLLPAVSSHRRASSLQAPAMRVASPSPMTSGRGSSLGPAGRGQSRGLGQRTSLSSVDEFSMAERPASRGSVNFSFPTSSRPSSPYLQWPLTSSLLRARPPVIVSPTNQNLVYDPNTRSFLPQTQILAIEQSLRGATNQPVKKKKKKKPVPQQAPATHLPNKTTEEASTSPNPDAIEIESNAKPEPAPSPMTVPEQLREPSPTPSPAAESPKITEKQVADVDSDSDGDLISHDPVSSDTDTDVAPQPRTYQSRGAAQLSKKPSIVREEREREEEEDNTPKPTLRQSLIKEDPSPQSSRDASPLPLKISTTVGGQETGQPLSSAPIYQHHPTDTVQNAITNENGAHPTAANKPRGDRVQSVSPARNAHFAVAPNNLVVKHQPPLRSISPRKSALKRTHMARGSSPPADITGLDYYNGSEASDELTVPRKKANRVSFDETNVVVGEAAPSIATDSPVVQSPQSKRLWYSLNRGKKKGNQTLDIDDDEVMKPRPALPSFSSVREKKASRDIQERPLVKPAPPEESSKPPSPPPISITTTEVAEHPTSLSNDHAAGALLAQDAATKNAANISKSREPLPPQVTSVEGNGYLSDSSSTHGSEPGAFGLGADHSSYNKLHSEDDQDGEIDSDLDSTQSTPRPASTTEESKFLKGNGSLDPASGILPPPIVTVTSPAKEWPDVPGGWSYSNSDSDGGTHESPTVVEHQATGPTPASIGVAEPTPEALQPGSPTLGNIAAENAQLSYISSPVEDSEDSDDNSIYSDAAEDLLDLEGDGFMSLDAIVDSPVVKNIQSGVAITTPESPTSKAAKQKVSTQIQPASQSTEPVPEAGWQKAQEYWKGLSSEEKRQLEVEAAARREDSEPVVETKAPKPRKKKAAIKKVTVAESESSERSYMIPPSTKANTDHIMPAELPSTPPDTHMRRSMRGQGSMGSSLRGPSEAVNQRGSLHKKQRLVSNLPPELKADPATVAALIEKLSAERAVTTSAAPEPMKASGAPGLRRRGSADSESSFKRFRQPNTNEIPAFRNSMRGSIDDSAGRKQSPAGTRRFSLRSLSPASSSLRQPMTPPPSRLMQNSMRNSVGPSPSLRGNNPASGGKSSFRLPSFSRSGPSKPTTKPRPGPSHVSRFADSSDEEDNQRTFQSRFVESSDEEDEPLPRVAPTKRASAPVRGIPKRRGLEDDDSTDLPDSDDEGLPVQNRGQNGTATQPAAPNGVGNPSAGGGTVESGSLRRSGSGRGAISPIVSTDRPDKSSRGSFMGILRRKKPDPSSKVRKSDAESAARRDTPLERSRSDLAIVRASARPGSPRLQKKNPYMPARSFSVSGAWPLESPAVPSGEEARPLSAGTEGVETAISAGDTRPGMGSRRSTAPGKPTDEDANGVNLAGGMAKKKKFGTLRRMFKLDD